MITDHTLDQCLIELARTMKALEALRRARKDSSNFPAGGVGLDWLARHQVKPHATALRASMDLTRKLADLRQGR